MNPKYTPEFLKRFQEAFDWIQRARPNIYPVNDSDIIKEYIDFRSELKPSTQFFIKDVSLSEDHKRLMIH